MANAFNGNGQSAEVRLEVTPSQTAKCADVHVDLDVGELSAADVNIVFAFDASGSLGATAYAQQLNAIQTAINDLRTQFDDASNSVQIKLLRFASGACWAAGPSKWLSLRVLQRFFRLRLSSWRRCTM